MEFKIENGVLVKYTGKDKDVVIPDGVTSIGDKAFYECSSLTSITIPDGVISIGDEAFQWCRSLTSIAIPDSVTSIGVEAFSRCRSLTSVTIPNGVTSIGNGAFEDCSSLRSIALPDGVTSIGNSAFWECGSLQSVAIPDSVTSIGYGAFAGCNSLQNVTIPGSVTNIGNKAFRGCESLTEITIPNSVTSIGYGAFSGCSKLKKMVVSSKVFTASKPAENMFGDSGKTIELLILREGKEPLRTIGAFRKAYWTQKWNYQNDFLIPFTEADLHNYDALVAAGEFEGFKMSEQGRLKAALLRLSEKDRPIASEYRTLFADFIAPRFGKAVKMAEEDNAPEYVRHAIESGAITDENRTKATNALKRSKVEEIRQMAEQMDSIMIAETQGEDIPSAGVDVKYLKRLREINAKLVLLKANAISLPTVVLAENSEAAPPEFLQLILAEYLPKYERGDYSFAELADEAAEYLNRKSLNDALLSLYESAGSNKVQTSFLPVLFRFADGATVNSLYRQYEKQSWMVNMINGCLLLSDTREAILLADRHRMLESYAAIRGTTEDDLRDQYLSEIGLDAQGGKHYDLGNQTVTVRLQQDLDFLVELPDGKTAKSLPKKGADEEKYASANADFAQMKKDAKKIVKSRCNALFGDFLSAHARSAEDWQRSYLQNPLLRSVAKLVVWSQGKNTFTLADSGAIRSDGSAYKVGAGKIRVAHPMEMAAEDVAAWQSYFRTNNIKQPFEQVWEPAYKAEDIKEDRYKGTEIFYRYAQNAEKHGIHYYDEEFHSCVGFTLDDCDLENELAGAFGHEIASDATFELGRFTFKKFTRKVNHIVYLFDKWTIRSRIAKDDISVMELMQRYNAAQITDFLNTAIENKAVNLTAALLSYKQEHFPEYDAFSEFTLE